MWLVRLALRRPYTFVVMAMLIVILGGVTISRMPTDIFPEIDIPVISVIWNYGGLPPAEMEKRIVSNFERSLTTTVNDIEHIESQSLTGVAVIKVFFQPGAHMEAATAQVTAIAQPSVRQMPPGATPPLVIRYSASNAPVLQLALESDKLPEQQLFDMGANFLRTGLATVQGAQIPWPYGGKQRTVMVDLDLEKLYAWGLSPTDITNAVNAQNLTLPSGTAKMGEREYPILVNSSPELVSELGDLPIKTTGGTTVYLRDVASVRDGFSPQTSLVHSNGRKAALLSILKAGGASTIDVVKRVRDTLPGVLATLPKELKVTLLFDQSVFVRAAVDGVVKEAIIAAGLTALMMLLFLGSWRSTLIVIVSIPLSILVAIIALGAIGETLNVMTLGGLALAVGILVDDATVEIENIHRRIEKKRPILTAILEGAKEIAVPAFVSTLCICIVFVPVAFISGAARSLFVPLAMSVVFSMLTSYFLSRTLVPTMVRFLLQAEVDEHAKEEHTPPGFFGRFHLAFERRFTALRTAYGSALAWALAHRPHVAGGFGALALLSMGLMPLIGRDFFPQVDAGLIRLHVRGPAGTRIEESERLFARIEETIRKVIPGSEIDSMMDNIGVPYSGINLSLGDPSMISSADGEILIALGEHHHETAQYVRSIRETLRRDYPEANFFFLAPDISTQVLNFGLSAPIDVQLVGPPANQEENIQIARALEQTMSRIPGAADVHLHQVVDAPQINLNVDRTLASQSGLTQRDAANALLVSLSSSGQTAPNYWLDQKKGVQYLVSVQTPQRSINSVEALGTTPLAAGNGGSPQLLANVASVGRSVGPANITHFNVAPTLDVLAGVDGRDLGGVAADVEKAVREITPKLPRGTSIRIKGQAESMASSFRGLGYGLIFAVLLVYLLMAVNFQSWLDPLIILMALPGAIAGIAWTLFLTQTTLSVPALMGAIMCIGVATANSILLITFANQRRALGHDAIPSVLAAGMTRLRPVLMTALAMIIGMLPMSLGLGEGGEQNAPLGRAVIGGLLLATVTTLFFVPVMYSLLRRKAPAPPIELEA